MGCDEALTRKAVVCVYVRRQALYCLQAAEALLKPSPYVCVAIE
jgi:hypothetical protein